MRNFKKPKFRKIKQALRPEEIHEALFHAQVEERKKHDLGDELGQIQKSHI